MKSWVNTRFFISIDYLKPIAGFNSKIQYLKESFNNESLLAISK